MDGDRQYDYIITVQSDGSRRVERRLRSQESQPVEDFEPEPSYLEDVDVDVNLKRLSTIDDQAHMMNVDSITL